VPPDIPRATYRVQLTPDLGFDGAADVVDYLAELGITHLYCSPYLQAAGGSSHGYDVVDQGRVSDDLGGPDAHRRLLERLRDHGMGHILDVVPNHMTVVDRANEWWWDVLKQGPDSPYAPFFDIDWTPHDGRLRRKILVPILGDHYGRVLRAGELRVEREPDGWIVRYHDHVLPIDPDTIDDAPSDEDGLHELLEAQHYRLAFWRVAGHDLNYRRFFSINELAALRTENPEVFDKVHRFVLDLVEAGDLQGLRVDHIDGLRDPRGYLEQLRSWAPGAYLVVEKILEPGEELRSSWPVEGTTGYDFMDRVLGLFVDPAGEKELTETYERFVGESSDLHSQERDAKLLLLDTELSADLDRLTDLFVAVCESHPSYRDFTRIDLREALRETIAAFPVYRTYVQPPDEVEAEDATYVMDALGTVTARRDDIDPELLSFLRDVLLLDHGDEAAVELALRFQQTTGPVMAKGIEDTLFYRYNRFVALNEVGGSLERFGVTPAEFHAQTAHSAERWPATMLATSTHDTKRSEDVRARLALLTQIPDRWSAAVERWRDLNTRHKRDGWPDPNAEYLLYQTLVGAWPLEADRAVEYMRKATKEAKTLTSWIAPDDRYDENLETFVRGILADRSFVGDLEAFVEPLVEPGRLNSLAQTLIKLTAPGVPDLYQGSELWDLSLVDPDNRRPVDFEERRRLLTEVKAGNADAHPKLWLIHKTLQLRAERPAAFAGTYQPLDLQDDALGYVRGGEVAVAVRRFPLREHRSGMGITGSWTNVLGEGFPVGLFVKDAG